MGASSFTLWDHEVITAPVGLVAGVRTLLASTGLVNNSDGKKGLRVILDYESCSPDAVGMPWQIGAIVEGQDADLNWFAIAYQFTAFRETSNANQRQIILQPDMSTFDTGIDDVMFSAGETIGRISRQQGFPPTTNLRVCLFIKDNDPTGPNKFGACTVSCHGERYDV